MDLDLARRLEQAQGKFSAEYANALVRLVPDVAAGSVRVAEGFVRYATFFGSAQGFDDLCRAQGFGLHGRVSGAVIGDIEAVFRRHGGRSAVQVCPLGDHSLLESLNERGYQAEIFEDVLIKELGGCDTSSVSPAVEIVSVESSCAESWAQTLTRGMTDRDNAGELEIKARLAVAHVPSTRCFSALVDGQLAGAGVMAAYDGVAIMICAGTLPPFRNRGVHTELLTARLAWADREGCDLEVAPRVRPGGVSHRNIERLGFRVAYTTLWMIKRLT